MNRRTLKIAVALLALVPAGAWGAGILTKIGLSAHHAFKGGYVWNDNPSATLGMPQTPNPLWNWNVSGAQNTVTRFATGYYQITFPNLGVRTGAGGTVGGNVQVGNYYTGAPVSCSVLGWNSYSPPDVTADIVCFDTTTGALTDSYFTALITF